MRRTRAALLLVALPFVVPSVGGLSTAAGRGPVLVVSGVVLVGGLVAAVAVGYRRAGRSDDGDESTWSLVPDWRYEGRFVEAGGLTVGEQSEGVERVRSDAEEAERTRK